MLNKFLEKKQDCCSMCRPDIDDHLGLHEVGGGALYRRLRGVELHEVGGGDPGVQCKQSFEMKLNLHFSYYI